MQKRTLPRLQPAGGGWAHPYGHGPFAPYLYADGGDGGDSGSDSGGSGDDDGADDSGDDGAGGTGDDAEDEAAAKDDKPKPKPPAKKDGDEDPAAELARLRKELRQANADAAKARTTAKKNAAEEAKAQLVQEIGKALGLVQDGKDEAPDPAKLTAEIERTQKAHRDAVIELAVYRGASKHGADPEALTDSRAFLKSLAELDPADEEFTKKVNAAIKQAVTDNPKLKAASAPPRNSGDFSGSSEKPKSKNSIEAQREAFRKARR
jgi:hypothetical protein